MPFSSSLVGVKHLKSLKLIATTVIHFFIRDHLNSIVEVLCSVIPSVNYHFTSAAIKCLYDELPLLDLVMANPHTHI